MITVDSTVSIDYIALGKIDNILKESLIDTAQALHTRVVQAQVLPFEYGTLQNESFFQDNTFAGEGYVMLVNATPYARRLYYHPEYTFWQGEVHLQGNILGGVVEAHANSLRLSCRQFDILHDDVVGM